MAVLQLRTSQLRKCMHSTYFRESLQHSGLAPADNRFFSVANNITPSAIGDSCRLRIDDRHILERLDKICEECRAEHPHLSLPHLQAA